MTESELAAVVRGIAPIVREQIAAAVGDLTPRLAALEVTIARLPAHEQGLAELRDRVVMGETKAVPPDPLLDGRIYAVDSRLTAALERLAAAEARLNTLGDLRDRVVTIETKAAVPAERVVIDLAPVLERLAAAEARLSTLGDLRDRVVTIETKDAIPAPPDVSSRVAVLDTELAALDDRVTALEEQLAELVATTGASDLTITESLGTLRERVAVVEVRAPVPGPAGKDGADGLHGKDGKDGADGLGFEDLAVDFDGDRTLALTFARGGQKKVFPVALPFLRYQGVYQDGKAYTAGDVVTWAGSTWTASEATTTKPGDGSKAWTLTVKRGRDGKDGRDAPGALPVVKVGT